MIPLGEHRYVAPSTTYGLGRNDGAGAVYASFGHDRCFAAASLRRRRGAAYSSFDRYGRLAASWPRRWDASPPGCYFAYFAFGHKRRRGATLPTATSATALDGAMLRHHLCPGLVSRPRAQGCPAPRVGGHILALGSAVVWA